MRTKGFGAREVQSIYCDSEDRFVVSLVVSYGSEVRTAKQAAAAALDLTRDDGAGDTVWFVHDRKTGTTQLFEQEQFDSEIIEAGRLAKQLDRIFPRKTR